MIIFIDLDRTVFNAHRFLNDLVRGALNEEPFSLSQFPQYVYHDAVPFLQKRKELGDTIVLVTRGDPEVQKTKAHYSGVLDFFSEALYVSSGPKASPIGEYLEVHPVGDNKVYFVDDTVFELQDVKETHPFIEVIRMRREDAKNHHIESPHIISVRNFTEFDALL